MFEDIKKVISKQHRVDIDTEFCAAHRERHNDSCVGCESEVGCHKLCDIAKVIEVSSFIGFLGTLLKNNFEPKTTPDLKLLLDIGKKAQKLIDDIIADKDNKYQRTMNAEEKKLAQQINDMIDKKNA